MSTPKKNIMKRRDPEKEADGRPGGRAVIALAAAFSLAAVSFGLAAANGLTDTKNAVWLIVSVLAAALIFAAAVLFAFRKLDTRRGILLITAAAMGLRLVYILGTTISQRQHDVYSFGGPEGHAGYIEYFYNHWRLPDFNPSSVFQFYHPPLHHFLAAVWLKINTAAGIGYQLACENIQILTMFYSGVFLYFTLKIFEEFGLEKGKLAAAYAFVAFYPAFIIMSGSINNDMLSIMLMQGAIYYAILWFKKARTAHIAAAAAFLGLGMMTKLSAGIAAVAIGFLFLSRLIGDRPQRRKFFLQFILFGAICFPLALWWGVRNEILFGLPVTYIPTLGAASHQYIGHYSLFERLADFSAYQFKSVYVAWGDPYFEHNVFIGLLKTGTFGEQTLSAPEGLIYAAAKVLFAINAFLALAVTAACPFVLAGDKRFRNRGLRYFTVLLMITFLLSYIQFCISYAHTCTQNIRYATPLIWIGAFVLAAAAGGTPAADEKGLPADEKSPPTKASAAAAVLRYAFYGIVSAFACSSAVFYVLLVTK